VAQQVKSKKSGLLWSVHNGECVASAHKKSRRETAFLLHLQRTLQNGGGLLMAFRAFCLSS
jgi:hypothetical protein